ncbi:MAG: polysaccharide biosynthesis tyrosine autokinase [Pseudonocardia sp.]
MSVDRALRALRERWAFVLLCVLLGLVGAGAATWFEPRQYSSDVTLYVSLQGQAETSEEAYEANELAKERALSYMPLLTDERVTQPTIDRLGLGIGAGELADRITVTIEPETTVLSAAVRDTTPEGAAAIANALAAEFVGLVGELEQPIGPAPPPPPPPGQPATPTLEPSRMGVQIVRDATPDPTPVSPDVLFNLALGAALGLLVGVAAVVVRAARDTSIRSVTQLQQLASVSVLAEVAHDRQVPNRPLIVDEPFTSARAETFRRLRNNLQFLDGAQDHQVLVVTSARPGEGTSTTACNLAIALAEAGNRVLLLDANLRSPRVADYLGMDPFPGLGNVLIGRMAWPYARQRWNRSALDVLAAGPLSHNPSQLLASHSMADLLSEMRQHYDFVVVDTPALLPVSDAAAVAARADGVVLVVQHRQTTEEQVADAMDALHAVSARLVGTVLTMTRGRYRRNDRVPSYRVPNARTPLPPAASPPPSPPNGLPQPASAEGTPEEDTTIEVSRPVDGVEWRPSPTPRS